MKVRWRFILIRCPLSRYTLAKQQTNSGILNEITLNSSASSREIFRKDVSSWIESAMEGWNKIKKNNNHCLCKQNSDLMANWVDILSIVATQRHKKDRKWNGDFPNDWLETMTKSQVSEMIINAWTSNYECGKVEESSKAQFLRFWNLFEMLKKFLKMK